MANEQNLKPIKDSKVARKLQEKSVEKRKQNQKEKRLFKEVIEEQLGDTIENIVNSMIKQSIKGNVNAATWLRDTAGQKPIDKIEADVGLTTIRVDIDE